VAKLEAQAANEYKERDGVAKLEIGMAKYDSYGWLSWRDG